MVGMPISQRGPVSTACPSSLTAGASISPMYLSEIDWTTFFPLAWPEYPNPNNLVLPRSSSKATIWFLSSVLWAARQAWAPFLGSPHSSPLQAMNLIVLLGLSPFCSSSLIASKQEIKPPPSSLAPVCDPVSQESIWPPISSISSGYLLPLISKMRLFENVLGQVLLSSFSYRTIVWFRSCILLNISASSTAIAANGILGYASLQCMMPVCTDYIDCEATERTRAPTAPYLEARQAPLERYCTLSPQVVQAWLQTTILPLISPLRAYSSSQLLKTMASALTDPATLPPNPITFKGVATGLGENKVRDSSPRTHLVKFWTDSRCTSWKPSSLAILCSSQMTFSSSEDPHILGPQVSEMQASRSYALWWNFLSFLMLLVSMFMVLVQSASCPWTGSTANNSATSMKLAAQLILPIRKPKYNRFDTGPTPINIPPITHLTITTNHFTPVNETSPAANNPSSLYK